MEPYQTDSFFSPTIRCVSTGIKFSPRLSMQRYITVLQVIKDFHKRCPMSIVTEFGCGSFVFFDNYLTKCEFINHVDQIDINKERLTGALHMIEANQFNKTSESERDPLTVSIFEGNVANKDSRVQNTDIVVAIEVIEHLFKDDLQLFPTTVFEFIRPKLVIMTTPNYDFNVLFDNGGEFRDEDHKFEFTKAQFIQWGTELVSKYPDYDVKFFGIGEVPCDCPKDIGYCTQMAIFEKKKVYDTMITDVKIQEYILIGSYAYFTRVDTTTDEEKLWQKIDSLIINYIVDDEDLLYLENENCEWGSRLICLSVNLLTENFRKKGIDEENIISLVLKFGNNYSMKYFECYGNLLIVTNECEQYCGIDCAKS